MVNENKIFSFRKKKTKQTTSFRVTSKGQVVESMLKKRYFNVVCLLGLLLMTPTRRVNKITIDSTQTNEKHSKQLPLPERGCRSARQDPTNKTSIASNRTEHKIIKGLNSPEWQFLWETITSQKIILPSIHCKVVRSFSVEKNELKRTTKALISLRVRTCIKAGFGLHVLGMESSFRF